jgi:hypothetical protein
MKNALKIRALDEDEITAVLELPKFHALKPVRCARCDHRGSFARRVFSITGVPKTKYCDDTIQNTISSYITKTFGLAYVFFKSPNSNFYADSAICPEYQSTRVVFDIELSDDFFRQAAKMVGQPVEELRRNLEGTAREIAKKTGKTIQKA